MDAQLTCKEDKTLYTLAILIATTKVNIKTAVCLSKLASKVNVCDQEI